MLIEQTVIRGLILLLVCITLDGCGTTSTSSEQSEHLYLSNVEAQKNRYTMEGHYQAVICERTLFWYLEYGDLSWKEKTAAKGTSLKDQLMQLLNGNCLDKHKEIQLPLVGKTGKLGYSYLLTFKKIPDGSILVLLDALEEEEDGKRNAKIIAYHIRTGQLRPKYLAK